MGKVNKEKFVSKKYRLKEIEYLHIAFIICKRECERQVRERVLELGGRVLSIHEAKGVARNAVNEMLRPESYAFSCIVCNVRQEDVKNTIAAISMEFCFDEPGNGKAFSIPVLGYMGNKALFV